jgi:hypothetical protein
LELKRLQEELSSESFKRLYRELRERHSALSPFPTPFSLIHFFHKQARPLSLRPGEQNAGGQGEDYATKDAILTSLINAYQKGGAYDRLGALFLLLFTPGIIRTHMLARKKALNFEPEEILSQTCLFFLETMKKEEIPPGSRKVGSQVIGKVKNLMRGWVRQRLKEEEMMEEFSEESAYSPLPIIDKASPPDLEEAERFLNIFIRAGVITETDKWIILGSKIVGQPLREIAGVPESYQKIKKRRQRALREMEKYLERKRRRFAMKEGVEKGEIALADVLKKLLR